MKIEITGIGGITPWGQSNSEFYQKYCEKKSAVVPLNSISRLEFPDPIDLKNVVTFGDFQPKSFMPPGNVRKYDLYSRLGIASSRVAFDSLKKSLSPQDIEDMGVVVGIESTGAISSEYFKDLIETGPEACSPRMFPFVSANTSGCHIAMEYGIQGQSLNVGGTFSAGFQALYAGIKMIQAERTQNCLVAGIDYLVSVNLMGFSRFKLFQVNPAFILGEASVTLLLKDGNLEVAKKGSYGTILGADFQSESSKSWQWKCSEMSHAECLAQALGSYDCHRVFLADFGASSFAENEQKAVSDVLGQSKANFVSLKPLLGESGSLVLLQVMAALCEPEGTSSLISIVAPGGLHGALLIESNGILDKENPL